MVDFCARWVETFNACKSGLINTNKGPLFTTIQREKSEQTELLFAFKQKLTKSHKLVFSTGGRRELNEHIRNVGFILQMKFSTTTQPGMEFFDLYNKTAGLDHSILKLTYPLITSL